MRLASPRSIVIVAITSLVASSCGELQQLAKGKISKQRGDSSGASGLSPHDAAMTVSDAASLPACDSSDDGMLVYVTNTKSFEACGGGQWTVIDLTGPKGDKGDKGETGSPGATAELTSALGLYRQYKDSVFRVTLTCIPISPTPSGCTANPPNPSVFLGTAFLCGDGEICTNGHVALCNLPNTTACYNFQSLGFQALEGSSDSVNATGTAAASFLTITPATAAKIKTHPSGRDLVKVLVDKSALPASAKILPLTSKPAKANVQAMTPTLSLGFPLGFQDLYTDIGAVNTPYIGECDSQGGTSGYGCPAASYAFSTTNDTDHGSSGSPLFDIDQGVVIGVTSAGTDGENANYTWAIDANYLRDIP